MQANSPFVDSVNRVVGVGHCSTSATQSSSVGCDVWCGRLQLLPERQHILEKCISFEKTRALPWQIKFEARVHGEGFKVNSQCFFNKNSEKQCLSDNSDVDIHPDCLLISSISIRAHPDSVYTVIDVQQAGGGKEQNVSDCVLTLGRASKIRYLPSQELLWEMKSEHLQQWFTARGYNDETCKELEEYLFDTWCKGAKVMTMVQDGVRPFVNSIMRMLQVGIVNRLDRDKLPTSPISFGELKKCFMCKLQSEQHSSPFMVMASSQNPMPFMNTQAGTNSCTSLESKSCKVDCQSSKVCFWAIKQGKSRLEQNPEVLLKLEKGMAVLFEELHDGLPENIERGRPYIISKKRELSFFLEPEHGTLEFKQARENISKFALMYHKEAEKANVNWCSIRADKLKSDANQFAKIFCRSGINIDLFESEMNGEMLFNMMEYCRAFDHESYSVVCRECSFSKQQYWHQPFSPDRIFITNPACNLDFVPFNLSSGDINEPWQLKSLSKECRDSRNKLFHMARRLTTSELERTCMLYCSILKEVKRVSEILSSCGDFRQDLRRAIDVAENAINDIVKYFMCEDPVSSSDREYAKSLRDQFEAEKSRANEEKERADKEKKRADAEASRANEEKKRADAEKYRADSVFQLSSDVDMPRSLCSLVVKTGSFLHAFLSEGNKTSEYRKSEKAFIELMYLEATKTPGLGPHCDGFPWPPNFQFDLMVPDENNVRKNVTTLTGLRLFSDEFLTGHVSCIDALTKSMMYVPVFTSKSLQQIGQQDCSSSDANRFLFQLIVARELHETSKIMMTHHRSSSARNLYTCALLRPIFLLKSSEIQDALSSFSRETMTQLHQCARRQLKEMGLNVMVQSPLSPHGLLSYFKDQQCYTVDFEQPGHYIKDIVTSLLQEISAEIHNLYMESIAYNFPQSHELVEFLSDSFGYRYAPILARHSIHSVQSLSTLDLAVGCMASVAKEAARVSHLSPEIEFKLISDVVASAKQSPLAQSINHRFDKHVDLDASVCTAVFSSSGIDIFFSKKLSVSVTFLIGISIFVYMATKVSFHLDEDFSCHGTAAIDTRWIAASWLVTVSLLCLGLISSSAVSFTRDPKLAKYVICVCLVLYAAEIGILELHLYNRFVFMQCPIDTSDYIRECCLSGNVENGGKFYFDVLMGKHVSLATWNDLRQVALTFKALAMCLVAFCCVMKQKFVVLLFLSCFIISDGVSIIFFLSLGASFKQTIMTYFPTNPLVVFCILRVLYWTGKRTSSIIAEKEAAKLNFSQEELTKAKELSCFDSLNLKIPAVQKLSDIGRIFEMSEFINAAFQMQTWIGSLLFQGPSFKEQCVFSLFDAPLPKSIAQMFDNKALNQAIRSRWNVDWIQPNGTFVKGPIKDVNRAISKIYRSYAGDVSRITDIVRCRVVLETVDDINRFLMMLEVVGWVETYDFNEAKQRVRQGENPLLFGLWSTIQWSQKVLLLVLFAWAFFKLHFLGLPHYEESITHNCFRNQPQGNNSDETIENDFGYEGVQHDLLSLPDVTLSEGRQNGTKFIKAGNARRGAFQIVRVKNRFLEDSPVGGYRDVNIKVRIGFKLNPNMQLPVFVPVENWDVAGVQTITCEIQVTLNE